MYTLFNAATADLGPVSWRLVNVDRETNRDHHRRHSVTICSVFVSCFLVLSPKREFFPDCHSSHRGGVLVALRCAWLGSSSRRIIGDTSPCGSHLSSEGDGGGDDDLDSPTSAYPASLCRTIPQHLRKQESVVGKCRSSSLGRLLGSGPSSSASSSSSFLSVSVSLSSWKEE